MRTIDWKFSTLALIAGMFVFTSCSNNDDDPVIEETDCSVLQGSIVSDLTLKSGNTYTLNGEFLVKEGATLNIEPGVIIVAQLVARVDYFLVVQGAKINAVGTASAPIIMTSSKEEPGAWGGIHLCGRAHTNAEGGKGSSEIGGATSVVAMMPTIAVYLNMYA